MPAENLGMGTQGQSNGAVGTLGDDDLLDALNAERAARARAEQLSSERDDALAKLQAELRDLSKLRDNFHSLYREERELREEADRVAQERSEERDALQGEVGLLHADVDRLNRMVTRFQAQLAEAPAAPAPAATAAAAPEAEAAPQPAADTRVLELERELGLLRAHAAELENAVAERAAQLAGATQHAADLEREVAMARSQLAGIDPSSRGEHAAELDASARRIHDLDGELASLRAEHADLRKAHERLTAARDALAESVKAEQAQRQEAQRFVAGAEQRVQEAVAREHEAVRAAHQYHAAVEHADHEPQAAKATIAVLERRVHDAEEARSAATHRAEEVEQELSFVRSDVLTGHPVHAAKRGGLLRRRGPEPGKAGHVETVGTPVETPTVEVSGTPEDVEAALHRRLFGGQ